MQITKTREQIKAEIKAMIAAQRGMLNYEIECDEYEETENDFGVSDKDFF